MPKVKRVQAFVTTGSGKPVIEYYDEELRRTIASEIEEMSFDERMEMVEKIIHDCHLEDLGQTTEEANA